MTYYKQVRQYTYTEDVIIDDSGSIIHSYRNYDDEWYDTIFTEELTEDELEEYDL